MISENPLRICLQDFISIFSIVAILANGGHDFQLPTKKFGLDWYGF
jgi:hypothetical protein